MSIRKPQTNPYAPSYQAHYSCNHSGQIYVQAQQLMQTSKLQQAELQNLIADIDDINHNILVNCEQLDIQLRYKTHESNIELQRDKLSIQINSMQQFMKALGIEETKETQEHCWQHIQNLINKNPKVAYFESDEVQNYFKTYTKVLQGQQQKIPTTYNHITSGQAMIKVAQMYANNQEENDQQRKKFLEDPDREIQGEDFREVAQKKFHKINDRINSNLKNNSKQRSLAQSLSQDERMDSSPSHQEYQGSEEITSDKKDRKSKSLDRTMSSSKAYYTSPIKKLQKP